MTRPQSGLTRRRMVALAGTVACGAPLAAACAWGGSPGREAAQGGGAVPVPKGEIRWMSRAPSEANRQIQVAFGPDFEQRNPGTAVVADWPAGNFQEKLTASVAGGDPPDLAFIAASQFQVLAAQ